MIRTRFKCSNHLDPRPVTWPLKHPYWVTGYGDDYAVIVAYADDEGEIITNWPDAFDIDSDDATEYEFSGRFPVPDWFTAKEKP